MGVEIEYTGTLMAGVDEVGRGPLAGPVIAAAVILDKEKPITGLDDSKKLSLKKREALYDEIREKAKAVGVGRAECQEIDSINILQASLKAMERAILDLCIPPEYLAIDGREKLSLAIPQASIIQGDSLVPAISAASIIAKVERDREMIEMDRMYPGYGFAKHKGYPTKYHLDALKSEGITPIHRYSFGPVRALLQTTAD